MKNKDIVDAALKYAERGWAVFPVSKAKIPLTENGFKDATTDKATILNWFSQYTGANIGIATGSMSGGLVIIDVDIDENAGKFGNDSLDEWCEKNGCFFSETLTATTGRGGKHYYFQSSEPFGCKVGALKDVDIRGEGGYVVVPPSKHKNGMFYKWDDEDQEIVSVQNDSDVEYFFHEMFKNDSGGEKFEIPEEATTGSRNDTLFKVAASYQARGMENDELIQAVQGYNLANCKPPLPDKEVKSIIKSVLSRYEKGKKKEQPEPQKAAEVKVKTKRKLKKGKDLMNKEIPEPIVYVGVGREDPLLVEGTCILSAKPKLGKSWFVLGLCLAICRGEDFLGYKTKQCSCLYLDLETSESLQKKRLKKAAKDFPVPDNFYMDTETDNLEEGFIDQIKNYLDQDPNIGVIVVDVFAIIRSKQDAKNKENEYQHSYRDIIPLNNLAQERHISIILVCHDRKMVDENDPFSNILGSTGLQGAVSQMIVMFRKRKGEPITIAIKGKTIDALPVLTTNLEEGQWKLVAGSPEELEAEARYQEFIKSDIRVACDLIAEQGGFKGSCSGFIDAATDIGYPIVQTAKEVGYFLNKNRALFLKYDMVQIRVINNGNGPKRYEISKSPLMTIDGTIDESLAKQGFIRV